MVTFENSVLGTSDLVY